MIETVSNLSKSVNFRKTKYLKLCHNFIEIDTLKFKILEKLFSVERDILVHLCKPITESVWHVILQN